MDSFIRITRLIVDIETTPLLISEEIRLDIDYPKTGFP